MLSVVMSGNLARLILGVVLDVRGILSMINQPVKWERVRKNKSLLDFLEDDESG